MLEESQGLTTAEAQELLRKWGPNHVPEIRETLVSTLFVKHWVCFLKWHLYYEVCSELH